MSACGHDPMDDHRSEFRRLKAGEAEMEGLRDKVAELEIKAKAKDKARDTKREAAERQVRVWYSHQSV